MKLKVILLIVSFLVYTGESVAGHFPEITGDYLEPECSDALLLAKSMFVSTSSRLYAPLVLPDGMKSKFVLSSKSLEISGGDALEYDESQFDQIPQPEPMSFRSIYWDKHSNNGVRVAVVETSRGWRGDQYSLYLLDTGISTKGFLKDIQWQQNTHTHTKLLDGSWRPPMVFQTPTHNRWFILVGEPSQILSGWAVYKESANGYESVCSISFRPNQPDIMHLLPNEVQDFAYLVDETLGPGMNEGTLRPTASIRLHVRHLWGNAAHRPWALSDKDTYNSTGVVLSGLLNWSKQGPSYRAVYEKILQIYPQAEQSLAEYYRWKFKLDDSHANSLAEWVLNTVFRAYYAFPNGNYRSSEKANSNPWDKGYAHIYENLRKGDAGD